LGGYLMYPIERGENAGGAWCLRGLLR
jgi:hypothetical protein